MAAARGAAARSESVQEKASIAFLIVFWLGGAEALKRSGPGADFCRAVPLSDPVV